MGAAAQTDTGAACEGKQSGVIEELSLVFTSARAALADFFELLTLEARRAGLALMWMLVCAVVAALCIVSAWLGLMVALIMGAVALGCPPVVAALAVAALNGVAAGVLIYRGINMSHDLLFSASRRQLAGKPPVMPAVT